MQQIALAVIGGTGVYNLAKLDDVQTHEVDTRFGRPSGPVRVGTLLGHRVAFLARHGEGTRCRRTRSTTAPTWPRCSSWARSGCWH
jgi:purine nucleoside phosphorylase